MISTDQIKEVALKLRGLFPECLYLGGSSALNLAIPELELDSEDMDFFIYSPRSMETWALLNSLTALGFRVLKEGYTYQGQIPYLIKGQYLYLKLEYTFYVSGILPKSKEVDLIFIDPERAAIEETVAHDLALVQYKVGYGEDKFLTLLQRPTPIENALERIRSRTPMLYIDHECTDGQKIKFYERASKLAKLSEIDLVKKI